MARNSCWRVSRSGQLERFLHKAYLGQKRFSIEGLDMTVPMLDFTIELAATHGTRKTIIGMAHRGRLNVLAHVVNVPYERFLPSSRVASGKRPTRREGGTAGTGDVKYHTAPRCLQDRDRQGCRRYAVANPSHLESVNPVVEGRPGRPDRPGDGGAKHDWNVALPILLHGDAAFAGQGVVAETFNLARLRGYTTGARFHLLLNNQIGFTTEPKDARSTDYSSDLAKGFDAPIVHVNADDPEACLAAVRLAMMYREKFHGDVVIDSSATVAMAQRGDEPAYTQPTMYERIKQTPPVREKYAAQLVKEGVVDSAAATRCRRGLSASDRRPAAVKSGQRSEEPQRIKRESAHRASYRRPRRRTEEAERRAAWPFRTASRASQAAQTTRAPARFAHICRRDRMGARRGARVCVVGGSGRPGPPDGPGHRAGHVQPAPSRAARHATTATATRRSSIFQTRRVRSSSTTARSPNTRAWVRIRVRRSRRRTRWYYGKRSSATLRTAPR